MQRTVLASLAVRRRACYTLNRGYMALFLENGAKQAEAVVETVHVTKQR